MDGILTITSFFAASGTTQRMDQRRRPSRCRSLQNRQIRTNQIPCDCAERLDRNLCVGSETISQVYGFQGEGGFLIDAVGIKLRLICKMFLIQSFGELNHRPLLVDLTVEEQTRLKVIYGSADGFHAVDLDSATVYDIYLPKHVSTPVLCICCVVFYSVSDLDT